MKNDLGFVSKCGKLHKRIKIGRLETVSHTSSGELGLELDLPGMMLLEASWVYLAFKAKPIYSQKM